MKRAVQIGSEVTDHLHSSKVEFSLIIVAGARGLMVEESSNLRSRQTRVRHHSVFKSVAQFYEFSHGCYLVNIFFSIKLKRTLFPDEDDRAPRVGEVMIRRINKNFPACVKKIVSSLETCIDHSIPFPAVRKFRKSNKL